MPLVLILAMVNGLLYLLVVPPWQHGDEPNHFEYSWLLARRLALPQPGDYDQEMRRGVAISMIQTGFFDGMGYTPNLEPVDKPVWIGQYSQLDDPPLYYSLAALPLFVARFAFGEESLYSNYEEQLLAVRLVSLALYILTIYFTFRILAEITSPEDRLRWAVPLGVALLPAFADVMTSVNSDVGAVAAFSFYLFGAVRLIRKGYSWFDLAMTLAALVFCYFTKRTALIAVPLFGVVLLLIMFRGRWRKLGWVLIGSGIIAAIPALFSWDGAWLWYFGGNESVPVREAYASAPLGENVFRIDIRNETNRSQISQAIPRTEAASLSDQPLTIGAWMWASQPVQARMPVLHVLFENQRYTQEVSLDTTPQFFSFVVQPSGDTTRSVLTLDPNIKIPEGQVSIYYDGLTLVQGEFLQGEPPAFSGPDGSSGTWSGKAFANLVRNASAERSGPMMQPWIDRLGYRLFEDYRWARLSPAVYALTDWQAAGWYHQATASNMLRTFWAKFGWGHISLPGSKPYRVLGWVTLFGITAALPALIRRRKEYPIDILFFFVMILLAAWGLPFFRVSTYIFDLSGFLPPARYTFPAIVPALFILTAGWLEPFHFLEKYLHLPGQVKVLCYGTFFLVLNAISIAAVVQFYAS